MAILYFSTKICLFFVRGKFLGGGKNLPSIQANGSAYRRPSIFPSTGGAVEPLLSVLDGIV